MITFEWFEQGSGISKPCINCTETHARKIPKNVLFSSSLSQDKIIFGLLRGFNWGKVISPPAEHIDAVTAIYNLLNLFLIPLEPPNNEQCLDKK